MSTTDTTPTTAELIARVDALRVEVAYMTGLLKGSLGIFEAPAPAEPCTLDQMQAEGDTLVNDLAGSAPGRLARWIGRRSH